MGNEKLTPNQRRAIEEALLESGIDPAPTDPKNHGLNGVPDDRKSRLDSRDRGY